MGSWLEQKGIQPIATFQIYPMQLAIFVFDSIINMTVVKKCQHRLPKLKK